MKQLLQENKKRGFSPFFYVVRNVVCFISVFSFFGCLQKSKEGTISLFDKFAFSLKPNEKLVPVNREKQATYQFIIRNEQIKPPLYRCIEGSGYRIYIGIPYGVDIQSVISNEQTNAETDSLMTFQTDGTSFSYVRKHNLDKDQVTFYKKETGNLIFILTQTDHSIISDTLFTIEKLQQRFIYVEN